MSTIAHLPERDTTAETIASNIRAEIARAGLTDAEFATRFGLSPMSMSRRLAGITPFTTAEVARAAAFFGVSIESLFTEHPGPIKITRGTAGAGRRRGLYLLDNVGPAGFEPTTTWVEPRQFGEAEPEHIAPVIPLRRRAVVAS
ncbi:MAG TPA: helix-turn-helix transcriptional regulator [Humibacter sp.]|nr:helix-turn-helix transcriptional regulator [Humibacter sp.]